MTAPLLDVKDLTSGYGDLPVFHGVSFHVDPSEVVSIVGANGAGKTTLARHPGRLRSRPLAGTCCSTGRTSPRWPRTRSLELGLDLVPEGRKLFPFMTVEENLRLGAYHKVRPARSGARRSPRCTDMFPRLAERKNQTAGSLSGGEQQMCAIARGLMALPKLLMLDEPSLGLAPIVVEQLLASCGRHCHARGLAVLLVEQNVAHALKLANYAYVLEQSQVAIEGPAADLAADDRVRKAYLGM